MMAGILVGVVLAVTLVGVGVFLCVRELFNAVVRSWEEEGKWR